jgi:hypothetical protein
MTDTAAREEAVERVRALAQGAIQPHEWGYRDPVVGGFVEDRTPFDLADHVLRLLLSGGEGGRLDAEPRLHVEASARGARPAGHCESDAAWEEFVAQYKGQPRTYAELSDFALANAVFMAARDSLDLIHYQTAAKERIRWLSIRLAEALTDPRQPSEADEPAGHHFSGRNAFERFPRLARHMERLANARVEGMSWATWCDFCAAVNEAVGSGSDKPSVPPVTADEGWRPIESAPRDGALFIATARAFSGDVFSHHDMHIVAVEDETGEIADNYEQGWRLEDYEFWRPLPAPPTGEGGGL